MACVVVLSPSFQFLVVQSLITSICMLLLEQRLCHSHGLDEARKIVTSRYQRFLSARFVTLGFAKFPKLPKLYKVMGFSKTRIQSCCAVNSPAWKHRNPHLGQWPDHSWPSGGFAMQDPAVSPYPRDHSPLRCHVCGTKLHPHPSLCPISTDA